MTLVVTLPLADPTIRIELEPGERLLDLGRRFYDRMADPASLSALAAELDVAGPASGSDAVAWHHPRAGAASLVARSGAAVTVGPVAHQPALPAAQRCLLARAAADALAEPADPMTRLRALTAAIRVVSATDPGLTASLDDIVLRTGSTQSSRDAMAAARRCELFDVELAAAELTGVPATGRWPDHPASVTEAWPGWLGDVGGTAARPVRVVPGQRVAAEPASAADLELVVDSDQQLPVALRLATWLAPDRRVSLSGRFVARHRWALARVPELAGVRLEDRVRTRWVVPEGEEDGPGTAVWVTSQEELPEDGPWAGWLDAEVVVRLPEVVWQRCVGLVVSACGPTSGTRPGARGPGLAGLVPRLAAQFPVGLEVVVGGPLSVPVSLDQPWWSLWGDQVRLAGFRPYRRPVPAGDVGSALDLARWAGDPDAVALEATALAQAAERYDLFPGRVAAAVLLGEQRPSVLGGYAWDPAVRPARLHHLTPDGRGPGEFLVSLRSGRLSRMQPSLGRLVTALRSHGPQSLTEGALPPGRRDELLTGLCRAGLLRRVSAA